MPPVTAPTVKVSVYVFTWIRFMPEPPAAGRVTQVWRVVAKRGDVALGWVRWDTAWRRYVFAPLAMTIYEQDCLRDLATFVEDRTREHKAARAAAR